MLARYVTKQCPACLWPFHCPVEQRDMRYKCRACEDDKQEPSK